MKKRMVAVNAVEAAQEIGVQEGRVVSWQLEP